MLILSRRVTERIYIPSGDIILVVVDLRGDAVRLGIDADPSIGVFREELWNRSHPEKPIRPNHPKDLS